MTPILEKGLIKLLIQSVKNHHLPNGRYTDQQVYAWEDERDDLLKQIDQLVNEDEWWADPEWERFIVRCLDHLAGTDRPWGKTK